jgi:hypothetical protein
MKDTRRCTHCGRTQCYNAEYCKTQSQRIRRAQARRTKVVAQWETTSRYRLSRDTTGSVPATGYSRWAVGALTVAHIGR